MKRARFKAIVAGAGPAGLTAAYQLSKAGLPVLVLESDPSYVGGLARTVDYKGFGFDIGGHRFFSKSREVEDLWTEIAGDDLLRRPRSSRIYYRGKFFSYPLRPLEALAKLGPLESAMCVLSFLRARLSPNSNPKSFEDWVSNQFGKRLYRTFFKTYTEKIWGMRCSDISADWAAQRIQGLSLGSAIKHAILPRRKGDAAVKTLIDSFRYPRRGPGMLWDSCTRKIRQMGGEVLLGRRVEACRFDAAGKLWTIQAAAADGEIATYEGEHLISSMPLRELVAQIEPSLPAPAIAAAQSLKYRDFLTVGLIVREPNTANKIVDNWIYIHDPSVKVGRIQNYKSWSPEMVPDPAYCSFGLEYFCFEGDGLWAMDDADLIALAKREIEQVGLVRAADVTDACVIRQRKAYPVYDDAYTEHVETVRQALLQHCGNIHLVGRNGMHKYNNQDHAMMTAMLTAQNIIAGEDKFDVWRVNQDAEYHESGDAGEHSTNGLRAVPRRKV